MRTMRNPRVSGARRILTLALALALVAGGCGGKDKPDLQIGLKRVALDLAFKDGDQGRPPGPEAVIVPTAVPSQAEFAVTAPSDVFTRPGDPPRPARVCPAAQAGAVPEEPATVSVLKPPTAGTYALHRKGTFEVELPQNTLRGAMPAEGAKTYGKVRPVEGAFEFDVVERTGDNVTSQTLRVTPTAIELVHQETKIGQATVTFTPTPAVTLMVLGKGEAASWNSAGVDTETGAVMAVQGTIVKRQNVDLCGTMYDTYVVRSTERITNSQAGYTSHTDDTENPPTGGPGLPNTYFVATHHGGLFIQEDLHTTTQLTVGNPPTPVTLRLDYTNTFDSIRPRTP
jgi:hypothetical protein